MFFFRGSALDYSGSVAGRNADEAKQNYFCGRKRICFASALSVRGFCIRRAGGCGRNARRGNMDEPVIICYGIYRNFKMVLKCAL